MYNCSGQLDPASREAVDQIRAETREMMKQMEAADTRSLVSGVSVGSVPSSDLLANQSVPAEPPSSIFWDSERGLADTSRRSSFKSSILDMGLSSLPRTEAESPGPTLDPLPGFSRRSSASAKTASEMNPEVVVTRHRLGSGGSDGSVKSGGSEKSGGSGGSRGQESEDKLMRLLPPHREDEQNMGAWCPPTTARFVGKMHAIVSHDDDKAKVRKKGTSTPPTSGEKSPPKEKKSPPTGSGRLTPPLGREKSLLHIMPAPVPTRFVGKMHAIVSADHEGVKRKGEDSSSRRSSIAPSTQTILEDQALSLDSPKTSPPTSKAKTSPPTSKAKTSPPTSKARVSPPTSRVKNIADKMKKAAKRKESPESGKSSRRSSMTVTTAVGRFMSRASSSSPGLSRSNSRRSTGSRNSKGSRGSRRRGSTPKKLSPKEVAMKKLKQKLQARSEGGKEFELEHRLFFKDRDEVTDSEILDNLGKDTTGKEVSLQLNNVLTAAKAVAKLKSAAAISAAEKKAVSVNSNKSSVSVMASARLVGHLKSKLSNKSSLSRSTSVCSTPWDGFPTSTRFLGKLVSKRDRHGLRVGTPLHDGFTSSQASVRPQDRAVNPLVLALQEINLKVARPESFAGSRSVSRTSRMSQGSSRTHTHLTEEPEDKLSENAAVSGLCSSMAMVRAPTIGEWNLQKNAREDKELLPIYIPF